MTPYELAWVVAAAAGVAGTVCLLVLTRNMSSGWFRRTIRWMPLLLLLVPAAIPAYEGNYAPAFVVAVFEALFQSAGNPWPALKILIITLLIGQLAILVVTRLFSRREKTAA
jgi:hypothetical protein